MDVASDKDHYQLLGIDRTASTAEIREAYFDLARLLHPDSQYYADIVTPAASAQRAQLFKQITNAYHVLMNAEQRGRYDSTLPAQVRDWRDEIDEDQEIAKKLEELGLKEEVEDLVRLRADPKERGRKQAPEHTPHDDRLQRLYRLALATEASAPRISAEDGRIRHERPMPAVERPAAAPVLRPRHHSMLIPYLLLGLASALFGALVVALVLG